MADKKPSSWSSDSDSDQDKMKTEKKNADDKPVAQDWGSDSDSDTEILKKANEKKASIQQSISVAAKNNQARGSTVEVSNQSLRETNRRRKSDLQSKKLRDTEIIRKTSVLIEQNDYQKLLSGLGVTLEETKEDSESSSSSSSSSKSQSDNQQNQQRNKRNVIVKKPKPENQTQTQIEDESGAKIQSSVSVTTNDILQIIESSEKQNLNDIESQVWLNSEVLAVSEDLKEYKLRNLRLDQLQKLQNYLKDQKSKYYSTITCLASFGKYLFLGCQSGIIRVIDMEANPIEDLRPLINQNKSFQRSLVTTLDVAPGMLYLVSGHQNGMLQVWDLKKFKLLTVIKDDQVHNSEIRAVKFYSIQEETTVGIISTEAKGPVRKIEVDKNVGIFSIATKSYSFQTVYNRRLKNPTGIAVHLKEFDRQKVDYWKDAQLVVMMSQSEIIVASLRSLSEEYKLKRPSVCRSTSVPSASFGYGSTPSRKDTTLLLLAIGWDCVIQIVYFDANTLEVVQDGIYYSDFSIDYLQFVADSTLMMWTKKENIQLIDTKKLSTGDIKQLESQDSSTSFNPFLLDLLDISSQAVIVQRDQCLITGLKGNDQPGAEGESVTIYENSITHFKRQTYFLSQSDNLIYRLSLRSYQEYLKLIETEDKCSWLQLLKAAVQIYQGEMTGFFNVNGDKQIRSREMSNFMQDFLIMNIAQGIKELQKFTQIDKERAYAVQKEDLEAMILRSAIEFCLIINKPDFLFDKIYVLFQESGLEQQFVRCLANFFKSGKLRQVVVSDAFIRRIIQYYESESEFEQIERTIIQLNLESYSFTQELLQLCEEHRLVRAYGHILLCKCRSDDRSFTFLTTLQRFFKIMQDAKQLEQQKKQIEKDKYQIVKRDDLYNINRTSQALKSELERTQAYICYKLLWLIQNFINGKLSFEQQLGESEWRNAVYDVVIFTQQDDFLEEILQLDAKTFFGVMAGLFESQAWKFILEIHSYRPNVKPIKLFQDVITKIQTKFYNDSLDPTQDFYDFVLQIAANKQSNQELQQATQNNLICIVDYQIVLNALKHQITNMFSRISLDDPNIQSYVQTQEKIIIGALRQLQIQRDDLEELIKLTNAQNEQRFFINIKVVLFEIKKDYPQAFKCLLQSSTKQHLIFVWLSEIFKTIKESGNELDINQIKNVTKVHMRELIQLEINFSQKKNDKTQDKNISIEDKQKIAQIQALINLNLSTSQELYCKMSVFILEKHFQEPEYIKNLVQLELAPYPKQQMLFLKTFVLMKETQISQIIHESVYSPELQPMAQVYNTLLVILTSRMCELEPDEVNLEQWLDKDYFPARQCMEVCKEKNKSAAEALLMNKIGDGMQSIRLYNQAISKLDPKRITDQLQLVHKEDWDFGRVRGFNILGRFDQLLEQSYKIAGQLEKDGYRFVYGEEGWFLILEFLQKLFNEAEQKIQDAKVDQSSKLQRITQLKSFYSKRISYVLKRDDLKLSLRAVSDRLSLHYEQIKNLCIDTHSKLKGDRARDLNCIKIQEKDILGFFQDFNEACAGGFPIYSYKSQELNKYLTIDKCQKCFKPVQDAPVVFPYESFQCGHLYHSLCLQNEEKCPVCIQKQLLKQPVEFSEVEDREQFKEKWDQSQSGLFIAKQMAKNMRDLQFQQKLKVINRQLNLLDGQILDECLQVSDFK